MVIYMLLNIQHFLLRQLNPCAKHGVRAQSRPQKGGVSLTKNQIDYQKYLEDVRHNVATEYETVRHNQRSEDIGAVQADAASKSAQASLRNAATNEANLAISKQNADTNYLNALTNQTNAETNQQNAETARRAQDLKEEQWYDPLNIGDDSSLSGYRFVDGFLTIAGRLASILSS